ncbi:hypothetical protein OH76DRAFT_1092404 [Lentinus brumalis]|uniref:Uncharacterized protein n=1 Tax=Lentinus brumalis TaxID=2498619 RepID=A0A371CWD4_9APHY|nr:hypothetical protein OH76DRAFT_1092404 [Polyporus brumalis]
MTHLIYPWCTLSKGLPGPFSRAPAPSCPYFSPHARLEIGELKRCCASKTSTHIGRIQFLLSTKWQLRRLLARCFLAPPQFCVLCGLGRSVAADGISARSLDLRILRGHRGFLDLDFAWPRVHLPKAPVRYCTPARSLRSSPFQNIAPAVLSVPPGLCIATPTSS